MSGIHSKKAPKPVGSYPHARRVGNLLFLSGVGSREPGTDRIPEGIEAQCHQVFANVKAVLEEAGSSWEKLVDVTVYLTDMKRDFPIYNRIYAEYFKDIASQPCRTTLEVGSLPTPIAIELKCVATID
jgi:2-aminomuconate deaminase